MGTGELTLGKYYKGDFRRATRCNFCRALSNFPTCSKLRRYRTRDFEVATQSAAKIASSCATKIACVKGALTLTRLYVESKLISVCWIRFLNWSEEVWKESIQTWKGEPNAMTFALIIIYFHNGFCNLSSTVLIKSNLLSWRVWYVRIRGRLYDFRLTGTNNAARIVECSADYNFFKYLSTLVRKKL